MSYRLTFTNKHRARLEKLGERLMCDVPHVVGRALAVYESLIHKLDEYGSGEVIIRSKDGKREAVLQMR